MQILLVENHDETARGVALLLTTWGHDATVVSLATEARAACAARGFDLIICDLGLPYESGLELMRGRRPGAPPPPSPSAGTPGRRTCGTALRTASPSTWASP